MQIGATCVFLHPACAARFIPPNIHASNLPKNSIAPKVNKSKKITGDKSIYANTVSYCVTLL